MGSLLQKTRGMNRLIQKRVGQPVAFDEMATVLSNLIETNVLMIGRRGKVLGTASTIALPDPILDENDMKNNQIADQYTDYLLNFSRTEIVPGKTPERSKCIVPVFGGGERLGTLIFEREGGEFSDDDLILAEYAATITGIEIMRMKNQCLEKA